MEVLQSELMIKILLGVEADNPLHLRCVCKLWKSLIVDFHFMNTHIRRSTTAIFDLLKNALNQYNAFQFQYIINNLVRRQEDGRNDEEIHKVVNAFEEVEKLLNTLNKLCEEENEKNQGDNRIALFNHILVVVIYMKENFNILRDIMQNLEDRVRCHQNCLRIYRKSITSSSSPS